MTEAQFDNGYWYAEEIKDFAKELQIPHTSLLRKDELEELIKAFLRTGKVKGPARKNIQQSGVKDAEKGLRLDLPILNYTNNKETKQFLVREALKIHPDMKLKSGARYRLNRWREEQRNKGKRITYGDLVKQYVKLNRIEGSYPRIAVDRYINFLADYLENEADATRQEAIQEWKKLKELDIPKNYAAWKNVRKAR